MNGTDPMKHVRFEWTVNAGQVLQMGALMLSIGSGVWWVSAKYTALDNDVRASKERALIYAPRVDALVQSQTIQDERIGNLATGLQEVRKANAEVLLQLGGVREDLAGIKSQLGVKVGRP